MLATHGHIEVFSRNIHPRCSTVVSKRFVIRQANLITEMRGTVETMLIVSDGERNRTFKTIKKDDDIKTGEDGVIGFNSGGNCGNGLNAGLFNSNLNNTHSNSNWNIGSSRSYRARCCTSFLAANLESHVAGQRDIRRSCNVAAVPTWAKAQENWTTSLKLQSGGERGVESTGEYDYDRSRYFIVIGSHKACESIGSTQDIQRK